MRIDEIWTIGGLIVLLTLLGILAASLIAGNIVNELLEPVPEVSGPLGAAVALFVFLILLGKGLSLIGDVLS